MWGQFFQWRRVRYYAAVIGDSPAIPANHNVRTRTRRRQSPHPSPSVQSSVVGQWIGNLQPIVAKQYLSVTDDHFAETPRSAASQPVVLSCTGMQTGLVPQQVTESTQDRTFARAGFTG